MSWKTTGAAIKAKRLELGLTLGAACRCCGISYEAWEDTEKGKRTLPEEDLERIGKRLGMDPFADGLIGDVLSKCKKNRTMERRTKHEGNESKTDNDGADSGDSEQ